MEDDTKGFIALLILIGSIFTLVAFGPNNGTEKRMGVNSTFTITCGTQPNHVLQVEGLSDNYVILLCTEVQR
jgi:hypothetical protein